MYARKHRHLFYLSDLVNIYFIVLPFSLPKGMPQKIKYLRYAFSSITFFLNQTKVNTFFVTHLV